MEKLGRGLVAVRTSSTQAYIGWRLLGNDPAGIGFNLYRITDGALATRINGSLLTTTTDFVDSTADLTKTNAYFVRPVIGGIEQPASVSFTLAADAGTQQYLSVPLQIPAKETMPDGSTCVFNANDCSVGDLDGDGEYEIIVKWDPSNSKDNSQSGYTGNVYIDAYKLNGTRLWRINLGKNIRAGAHYTQFMVYDLDGDGKAEIACKTADGTIDGLGNVIGDATADYRSTNGYVLDGPEYLTVFNGLTGAALATTDYVPARGKVTDWGDGYGNRVDRFNACIAYLDGVHPSLVMCRGYYTRTAVVAWDYRNGQLTQRWHFDTRTPANLAAAAPGYADWEHMGNHQISVADIDGDGKDEILFGAIAIDHDGLGLYTTGIGHGDAYHVSKMDPDRDGLQVYGPHEVPSLYGPSGSEMHDALTGEVIFSVDGQGADVGRGCAFDIDPRTPGFECWSARGGLYTCKGALITSSRPGIMNFGVWWDADPLRELLDGTTISKWDWVNSKANPILTATGCSSNNSTKATPNLSADILGDWREEVIWRTSDNSALRIYTTTIPANNRMYTLMHDRQYREAIAWQNSAYNQPPHPSFYLGDGMGAPPTPSIYTPGAVAVDYQAETAKIFPGGRESANAGFTGSGYAAAGNAFGAFVEWTVQVRSPGTYQLVFRYANGSASARPADLSVNGAVVQSEIPFPDTIAWTSWSDVVVTQYLTAGVAKIRIAATTDDGLANLDKVTIK